MQSLKSRVPAAHPISIGLTILALGAGVIGLGASGCRHAEAKPESEEAKPAAEAAPAEEKKPAPAAEPDTSTLSGRLQKLGQEIESIPENTARRFGPELERIEKMRDDLSVRIKKEGAIVGERIEGAVQTLEDDLRVLRTRMNPPRPSDDDEGEDEGDAPADEEEAGE